MPQTAEVFLSYSRDDHDRVFDLAEKLRAAGVSMWIDTGAIDAASLWSEQIVNALESAKVLLLVVTESAVRSDNVAKEVMLVSERKGHILPVYLEPTVIPPALRYQLAGIQHVEYFKSGDEAGLKTILRALERVESSSHRRRCRRPRRPLRYPPRLMAPRAASATHWRCCRSTTSARTRRRTTSVTG